MNWTEIQASVNEWIWDNFERTYFWLLNVDPETKMMRVRGLSGLETELLYGSERFFKHAKQG